MESCPNCGTPGRLGAKFCTTCGYRIPDDEIDPAADGAPADISETELVASGSMAAWPAVPSSSEALAGGDWGQNAAAKGAIDVESTQDDENEPSTLWSETAADPWPSPPGDVAAEPIASGSVAGEQPSDAADEAEQDTHWAATAPNHAETADASARATQLLDELRDAIGAIGREPAVDLSGVISDLDVAATPPGALAPEEVAELRDALLAARERPRDVDTIVDLTKRVDSLLALVIAYDRAIAAIERSLDVLRNEGDGL